MSSIVQDFKYALRSLGKSPGFAAAAILTMALGIGANTAIFTIVNAVVLRPLPYPGADRLVMVWQDLTARGGPPDEWASPGNFVDWSERLDALDGVAAISGWRPTLTGAFEPEPLVGEQVSHEYFGVLGVGLSMGRDFAAADDVPGAPRVAVIGDDLWRRRFAASPSVVGQIVTLAGEPHEIVGVLPPGVRPIVAGDAEIWRPLRLNRTNPARGAVVLRVVARLADGATLPAAQAAATDLASRLEQEHPEFNEKTGFKLQPLHERVTGEIRPALLALLGAVAFVLLIACANIANLLLARASHRARELAVRAAIGAGRGRIVRQLVTESLALSALGGVAGLVAGAWAVDALVALAPSNAPRLGEVALDRSVLLFTAVITVAAGILFGLAPAVQHARPDASHLLKEGGRGMAGSGGRKFRQALVAIEVALALVLLSGGALLIQTFARLQSADLGFRTEGVLTGTVVPPRASYDTPERMVVLYDRLLERAQAIPGVRQAALSSVLPLSQGDSDMSFEIIGRPAPQLPSDTPVTWYRLVSAGYFDAIGMRLVRGRGFADREAAFSIVVNETFVRRYFADEDPLGRQVRFGPPDRPAFAIVGVVADVKARGAREDVRVETFIPNWQMPEGGTNIVLVGSNPAGLAAPLRQAVMSVDPNLPVIGMQTMAEALGESVSQPRFLAALSGGFALVALGLAAIGIYGVMAYAVQQRTGEIGVRMALGASRADVFRQVVGDGMKIVTAGVVAGMAGALVTGRWLTGLLFGVTPADPAVLGGMAAVLVAVAVAASALPARRAARVDPVTAMREE
jgi:putative ABC transport system permease protein